MVDGGWPRTNNWNLHVGKLLLDMPAINASEPSFLRIQRERTLIYVQQ